MKSAFLTVLLPFAVALAQTPYEFAVVEDLIGGTPHVSVLSIELEDGVPAAGDRTLRMAARVGLNVLPRAHTLFADSLGGFTGQTLFGLDVDEVPVSRVLQVVSQESRRFSSMHITHLALDMVSYDDASWISVNCPMGLVDSVASGLAVFDDIWSRGEVSSLEIGTTWFALDFAPPVSVTRPDAEVVESIAICAPSGGAWKSLILPGWGQLDAGRGVWWMNLLVEAAGVGLLASDHQEEGIAVLGANHVISFLDLL